MREFATNVTIVQGMSTPVAILLGGPEASNVGLQALISTPMQLLAAGIYAETVADRPSGLICLYPEDKRHSPTSVFKYSMSGSHGSLGSLGSLSVANILQR